MKGDKGPNAGDGHTQDSQRSQPPGAPATAPEGAPVAGTTTDVLRESGQGTCALLEEQRWKFRALTLTCTAIFSIPEVYLRFYAQLRVSCFEYAMRHCELFSKIIWSLDLILLIIL